MPESMTATAATASPSATDLYALGRDPGESARLQRQSQELRPDSAALLDRVGLGPGQDAIDLGCGPRGILDLLAERVSPGGRVAGLDADPVHVAMAREFTAQRGLGNVEIVAADARRTGLPPGSFDLVHARTLLVNVPEPVEVVAEMVRLAKPGGWVAGLEPDVEGSRCATRPTRPIPGSGNCSAPPSAGTAPICSSAAAWPSCTTTRGCGTSASRHGRRVPGRGLPPDDRPGPGAQPPPGDRQPGPGRPGRARCAGPRSPGAPR